MGSRAKGRLALAVAAAIALVIVASQQSFACENCAPGQSSVNLPANALPTYPEPTEQAAEPVTLRKFTKPQSRTGRRTKPRNAALAQRASGSRIAARKAQQAEEALEQADAVRPGAKPVPFFTFANANAELVEPAVAARPLAAEPSATPAMPLIDPQIAAHPPSVELVSADEFNELDRAAWEANQIPKLMQLTSSNSRAELRDSDSTWAHTSTIGKLFVVFGALLTIGSAIRMFMA